MKEKSVGRRWWNSVLDVLFCRIKLDKDELGTNPVSFFQLFRYATTEDKICIFLGCICALLGGLTQPIIQVADGMILSAYLSHERRKSTLFQDVKIFLFLCVVVGFFHLVLAFLQSWFFQRGCCSITNRIQRRFLASILKQDPTWLVGSYTKSIPYLLNSSIQKIEDGLCQQLGKAIRGLSLIMSTLIICFYINWKITLIIVMIGPLVAWTLSIAEKVATFYISRYEKQNNEANSILEESLTNLKTVASLNAQDHMLQKFISALDFLLSPAIKCHFWTGFIRGLTFFQIYVLDGFTFTLGIYGYYNGWVERGGDVLIVVNAITISTHFLCLLGHQKASIVKAKIAAATLYEIIDQQPTDKMTNEGITLENVKGSVEVENITFNDPSKETLVLKKISWKVMAGETIAFVGNSRSGKSTAMKLLAHPNGLLTGKMLIDQVPLDEIKRQSLNKVVGIVEQEPCLFNGTIIENITLGREGITKEDAKLAAKIAKADEFIEKFPKDYKTVLGVGGVSLSQSQKQRIAIARAIATDPKILLLDDILSGLDFENERILMTAIKQACVGRTIVIITCKLSILRNVDKIYVFDQGSIVENGIHQELIEKEGQYAKLVKAYELDQHDEIMKPTLPMLRNRWTKKNSKSKSVSFDKDLSLEEEKTSLEPKDRTSGFIFLYKHLKGNYRIVIPAIIFAILRGLELPLFSVQSSFTFKAFQSENRKTYQNISQIIFILCVTCGLILWLLTTGLYYLFGWIAEIMMSNFKATAFHSLVNRPISSFNKDHSSPTACVAKIKTHVPNCGAAFDHHVAITIANATGVVVGLTMAFFFQWEIGLLGYCLCFLQFMIVVANFKISNVIRKRKETEILSRSYASEIIEKVKMIQMYMAEKYFLGRYNYEVENLMKLEKETNLSSALYSGLITSFLCFFVLLSHCLNIYLIVKTKTPLDTIIMAYMSSIASCISLVHAAQFLPDIVKSRSSARILAKLIDRDDAIEHAVKSGDTPKIEGEVCFSHVDFSHSLCSDVKVAKDLCITAKKGERIALVGGAGPANSALFSLLKRFYIADFGQVQIDNKNIRSINIPHLRNNIASISKDPIFFNGSIIENITMGIPSRKINLESVIDACKKANAAHFIEAFPCGYETEIGEKGKSLSKSQKLRISIARALVRDPKIILLDDPTAELDPESKKAVEAALDEATKGRTTVIIAHKISDAQSCDRIFMIEKGTTVESGSHEELLQLKGKYFKLVEAQHLGTK